MDLTHSKTETNIWPVHYTKCQRTTNSGIVIYKKQQQKTSTTLLLPSNTRCLQSCHTLVDPQMALISLVKPTVLSKMLLALCICMPIGVAKIVKLYQRSFVTVNGTNIFLTVITFYYRQTESSLRLYCNQLWTW